MAGPIIQYDTGEFYGTYTPAGGAATEIRLKWGTTSGSYPNIVILPYSTSFVEALHDCLPGAGQYYAIAVAANYNGVTLQESSPSAEVAVEVIIAPITGSLRMRLRLL